MTNEERSERLFALSEHIGRMQNALYGQRVMWVTAKKLDNKDWMLHIELTANNLKEKIKFAEAEYELLFAGEQGLQCSMFEGECDEKNSKNNAGTVVTGNDVCDGVSVVRTCNTYKWL